MNDFDDPKRMPATCERTDRHRKMCGHKAIGASFDVNGEYGIGYCKKHEPLSAQSENLAEAMHGLGAALWAQRLSFMWFFIATAFIGVGLRLVAWRIDSDGLDEFGQGIADASIVAAFALIAATWWSRRGGSDVN